MRIGPGPHDARPSGRRHSPSGGHEPPGGHRGPSAWPDSDHVGPKCARDRWPGLGGPGRRCRTQPAPKQERTFPWRRSPQAPDSRTRASSTIISGGSSASRRGGSGHPQESRDRPHVPPRNRKAYPLTIPYEQGGSAWSPRWRRPIGPPRPLGNKQLDTGCFLGGSLTTCLRRTSGTSLAAAPGFMVSRSNCTAPECTSSTSSQLCTRAGTSVARSLR